MRTSIFSKDHVEDENAYTILCSLDNIPDPSDSLSGERKVGDPSRNRRMHYGMRYRPPPPRRRRSDVTESPLVGQSTQRTSPHSVMKLNCAPYGAYHQNHSE